jgi:hypothetical protein
MIVLSLVLLFPLIFILLWAVTYHFLRDSRLYRLAICFGVLIALSAQFNPFTDASVATLVVGIGLILGSLEWAVSRSPR